MNFCPQCGRDIHKTTSDQPIEANDIPPMQVEAAKPVWVETAAVISGTAPARGSEKQKETAASRQPGRPTDARSSSLNESAEAPEAPAPASSEGIQAEREMTTEGPPPIAGGQAGEAGESFRKRGKGKKWILGAALCVIAAVAAGICLWPRNDGGSSDPTEPKADISEPKVDISEIAKSVLYLEAYDENDDMIGSASGFLVNDQRTLVTNYHVVQDAYHIVAMTADGARAADVSCILAYDEIADLAVLSCDSKVMAEPLTIGDSEAVRQGDAIYAVGYPLGVANTLSNGIVSSRYIDEYGNDTIQVTAAISGGNSGGPLLDEYGQAIGVMCAYYVYGQNLNLAIASNTLTDLLGSEYEKTDLKYWKDRPAMPGEQNGEEDKESEKQEAPPPQENAPSLEGPNESSTPSDSETGIPRTQPESQAPKGTSTEIIESDSAITAALQGMWIDTSTTSGADNIYCFCKVSGYMYYEERYYKGFNGKQVSIDRGTFTIKDGALCVTITSVENYRSDGYRNIEPLNEVWNPRAITEISESKFTIAPGFTYVRTDQYPNSPLASWGLTAFSGYEVQDVINNVIEQEYSSYYDYGVPDFGVVNGISTAKYDPSFYTYYHNIGFCYSPLYYYEEEDPAQRIALCETYQQVLIDEGFVLQEARNTSDNKVNYTYAKAWKDGYHICVFIVPSLSFELENNIQISMYVDWIV